MQDRNGFTLIELLIVVVVIGILAAIAIPRFSAAREEAFKAAMMADLKSLAGLQEIYHSSNHTYSTDLGAVNHTDSDGVTTVVNSADGQGWAATAVHVGVPSQQCGVYHGAAAAAGGSPGVVAGVIACTY